MGLINSGSKSNRLLGSRRFTSVDLNTSQEAFTSTLDIQASEVYTEANLIPTSSLPFSGSSQHLSEFSVNGHNIVKYWFRQRLTPSNVDSDVWFFLAPTGSSTGVTPQLINSSQQTNFISPKYSIVSLANANTEDNTPGYGIRVFKSTSTNSGSLGGSDVVSSNDFQFDFKTGVLQFNENKPSASDIIYMTAYQYVGTTLETGIQNTGTGSFNRIELTTNISGSSLSTASFGNLYVDGNISASGIVRADAFQSRIGGNAIDFKDSINVTGNLTASGDMSLDDITATGNISSSITSTGSFGRIETDGAIKAGQFVSASTFVGVFSGSLSSSIQIATEISGAFTSDSSSFALRATQATASIAGLKTDSGSFSTRITTEEANVDALQTDSGSFSLRATQATASIAGLKNDSGSFSTRITALKADSASFSTRVTTEEANVDALQADSGSFSLRATQATASIAGLKTDSGSFSTRVTALKADSASFSTRVTAEEANVDALQSDSASFSARITNEISGAFDKGFVYEGNISSSISGSVTSNLTEIINVIVVSDGGNKYAFEGATTPNLSVEEGKTYRFEQSDGSNGSHPFRFSTTENGSHGGGSAYTTNVKVVGTPGSSNSYTEIKIDKNTPNHLYYYCTAHSGMGNQALILKTDLTNLHKISGSLISTASIGRIIAATDITATKFSGTFLGAVSQSTQLATEISGAFTADSSSLASRLSTEESNVDALQSDSASFSARFTNEVSGAFAADSSSISLRLTQATASIAGLKTDSGSFSTRITTEEANVDALQADSSSFSTRVTTEEANVDALQADSASFSTRVTTNESKLNQNVKTDSDVTFATLRTTGDIRADGDVIANQLIVSSSITHMTTSFSSGSTVFGDTGDDTHKFTGSLDITGSVTAVNFVGMVSSSNQISTEISGAFTADSSSFASRFDTEVSGAFTVASSSLASRIATAELELTNTLVSSSNQISTEISGAFTANSASLASRIATAELELTNTLVSSSNQISTEISGAFDKGFTYTGNISSSISGSVVANLTEIVNVMVVSDGGNKYAFEGATTPDLSVEEGKTYRFEQSDGSNSGHPFRFSTTENGSHGGGSAYSTNVTVVGTPGGSNSYTEIKIDKNTPNKLYYYCTAHSGMGNNGLLLKTDLTNLYKLSGSLDSTASFGSVNAVTDISAAKFSGKFLGAVSSSTQIATEISGAFITTSSSLASRLAIAESELSNTLVSSSNQIATEISGAFTSDSSSFATKITALQSDSASFSNRFTNEISGAFASTSASFSNRFTNEISGAFASTSASFSNRFTNEISGAFTSTSSSLASRLTTAEVELTNTLISSSTAIATEISGAFTSTSASLALSISNVTQSVTQSFSDGTATLISASITSTGSFGNITGNRLDLTGGYIAVKNEGIQSQVRLYCESNNAHYVALQAPAHSAFSGNVTVTLPSSTDTLVGRATTDTLTNKTLTSPTLSGTIVGNVSASITSTGSFGALNIDGGHFTSASLAAGGGGGTSFDGTLVSGSFVNKSDLSGSLDIISGSLTSTGSFGAISVEGATFTSASLAGNGGSSFDGTLVTGSFITKTEGTSSFIQKAEGTASFVQKTDLSGSTSIISGSITSTGSFGVIAVGGGVFTSASLAATGDGGGGGSFDGDLVSGSFINKTDLSGSLDLISGSIQSSASFSHLKILGQNFNTAVSESAAEAGFGEASNTVTLGQLGFFGSGSAAANVDAGIVVQSGSTVDSGSSLFHDTQTERWSVAKNVGKNDTAVTPLEFVTTAKIGSGAPADTDKEYGQGEIYVDNDSGDIFIYA